MDILYTWNTPNGQKPAILLEELGANYVLNPVDLRKNQQFSEDFRTINPNGKIPAWKSDDGLVVFESGAILQFLAERHGRFLGQTRQDRARVMSWSFWQVGGLGPMMGQWAHFDRAEPAQPYAADRFLAEVSRLLLVIETVLEGQPFVAGEDYTIADIMIWPWLKGGLQFLDASAGNALPAIPFTRKWAETIGKRPAVSAALSRLSDMVAASD